MLLATCIFNWITNMFSLYQRFCRLFNSYQNLNLNPMHLLILFVRLSNVLHFYKVIIIQKYLKVNYAQHHTLFCRLDGFCFVLHDSKSCNI